MIAQIKTQNGTKTFTIRLLNEGDAYGLNNSLTANVPLVEVYDRDYMHTHAPDGTPLGQFVSRYYVSTFLEPRGYTGLNLDGGVSVWYLDAETMHLAQAIVTNWTQL